MNNSSSGATNTTVQQQQDTPLNNNDATTYKNVTQQDSITDIDLNDVMVEYHDNQVRNLDPAEFMHMFMKENMCAEELLSHIENPGGLYPSIRLFMEEKMKEGESFTNSRMIYRLNNFISKRMSKILSCVSRHYDNKTILDQQKSAMTPQERELFDKVYNAIIEFRDQVYK